MSELIEQLKSGDLNARRDAVYALADLGEKATPAVPALTDLIDDKDQQIWFQSTMALARIGPDAEAAIPKLLGKLGDRDE
ncbi:MAG: HEAT repeat domain-containing protein, partial [Planctomycetota bacterium]|nr:HEAT repeat domain-containing protein [Planctomycetota bacterium]